MNKQSVTTSQQHNDYENLEANTLLYLSMRITRDN